MFVCDCLFVDCVLLVVVVFGGGGVVILIAIRCYCLKLLFVCLLFRFVCCLVCLISLLTVAMIKQYSNNDTANDDIVYS